MNKYLIVALQVPNCCLAIQLHAYLLHEECMVSVLDISRPPVIVCKLLRAIVRSIINKIVNYFEISITSKFGPRGYMLTYSLHHY